MTQRKMYSFSTLHQPQLLSQPNAPFILYHPSLLDIPSHRGCLLVLLVVVDFIVPATVGRVSMRSSFYPATSCVSIRFRRASTYNKVFHSQSVITQLQDKFEGTHLVSVAPEEV